MSALPLFTLDAPMPIWDAGYPAHDGVLRARALTNEYIGQLGYPVALEDTPVWPRHELALARADRPDYNDRLPTFDRAMGLPFRRLPTPPPLPAGFGRNAHGIMVGLLPFSPPPSSTSRVSDDDDDGDDVDVLDEDEVADPPSSPTPSPPRRSTRIEKKKLALAAAAKKAKVTNTRTRRWQKVSVKERVALAVAEKKYKDSIARDPDNMKCPFASCGWFTPINAPNGSQGDNGAPGPQYPTYPTRSQQGNTEPAQSQPDFYGWTPYMVNGAIVNKNAGPSPAAGTPGEPAVSTTQVPAPVPAVTSASVVGTNDSLEVDEIDELLESESQLSTTSAAYGLTPRRKRPPTSGRAKKTSSSTGGN
ncbi:hypothetical protein AURDEDRAFT_162206 [Auricularia subglabra TFB-10046 SS5]|nr:hypothetical protein AURDEDRAFT_162206 [Auricularia subglabra TFB-10046 SS5]